MQWAGLLMRFWFLVVAVDALAFALGGVPAPSPAMAAAARPNLVFILDDDQRIGTMSVMPATRARFEVRLTGFSTTPLCSPSRSEVLTGEYAHNTGVRTNNDYPSFQGREADSIGPWLQAQGYYTGFFGKYFNHYFPTDPTPPGWDEFRGIVWRDHDNHLWNWTDREHFFDGSTIHDELVDYPNAEFPNAFSPRVFATLGARFIAHAADPAYNPTGKPWALFIWPAAPNGRQPEPRYAHAPLPTWIRPPSFMEPDMSDKPIEIRRLAVRTNHPAAYFRGLRRDELHLQMSVDNMVKRVFSAVDLNGYASSTYGFFASDNGRLWGEHHLKAKRVGYEESVRVPMRMHVPDHRRTTLQQLVGNIDIVPTMLDLAGDPSTHGANGRSLLPLINGTSTSWRHTLLLENWEHNHWAGVRTTRWKFVHWYPSGHQELYDLRHDPFELENVAREHPLVIDRLRRRMRILRQR